MSYETVVDHHDAYHFITRFYGLHRTPYAKGLCQRKDGRTVAAVLYDEYNGSNIFMHVAAEPGKRWLTRDFRKWAFHYPFRQLGVRRITGWVEASNMVARQFDEKLGFRPEAILHGAAKDGGDVILYVMFEKDCRYV